MAKKRKPDEEELIIEDAPQVGGPVYSLPELDGVTVKNVDGPGQPPRDPMDDLPLSSDAVIFDASVGEVEATYYDDPAGGSPYGQTQAISVGRSDIAYGTNNDPVITPTPGTVLTVPDELAGAMGPAKPFPPRHDQAGYVVDAGDPVLTLAGKDGKNWYMNDELPFVAQVTAISGGLATVKRRKMTGDPDAGGYAGPDVTADLLDKDSNVVTYPNVLIIKSTGQERDLEVGNTVWVDKRGRYYFITNPPELPIGTKNSRLLHSGSVWTVIREGVVSIATDNGDGTYVGTEQQWDDDVTGWIDATATGFLSGATFQDILDRDRPQATTITYFRFWQTVDEDGNVDNIVDISPDGMVLCSDNDTTLGLLEDKIVGDGTWTSVSTLNDGADEDVQVAHEDWNTNATSRTTVGPWYGANTAGASGTHLTLSTTAGDTTAGQSYLTLDGFIDEYDAKKHSRVAVPTTAVQYINFAANADEKVGVDAEATAGYIGATGTDGVLRVNTTWISYVDGINYITLAHTASPEGQEDRIQYTAGASEFIVYKSGASSTNTWVKVEWGAVGHVAAVYQSGNTTSFAWPSEVI